MVADALIYHPSVAHYLRFVATTVGRDKLLRVVQYFARFYAWYLLRTNGVASAIAPWNALKKQFGLTRKLLRIGKNVEHFKAAATAADAKSQDPILRYTAVGRQLGYAGYLTCDAATVLDAAGVRKWAGAKRFHEQLKDGGADEFKGSFYANCAFYVDPKLESAQPTERFSLADFPEYLAPNSWPPKEMLPGFRPTMEQMCSLVIDTAVLVARACDRFAEHDIPDYPAGYLEHVVKTSSTTKARLLHYYPMTEEAMAKGAEEDNWCAVHKDHGCLTGLTSAMFVDEGKIDATVPRSVDGKSPEVLPTLEEMGASPDPQSGLWIKDRRGTPVQVKIPRDCLAFQTGETLERITRGKFKAVEHSVRGAFAKGVARNTLAVFTQPNLDDEVDMDQHINFGEFARGIIAKNTV